jgi:hypothetical protein
MKYRPKQVKKALVAFATLLSQALSMSLVPAPYDKYALLVLGVLGVYGVFKTSNAPLEDANA